MHYLIFFQNILSCTSDSRAVTLTVHMCNTCQNFKKVLAFADERLENISLKNMLKTSDICK